MARAKAAGEQWRRSSFRQRRQLLKIILKFIVENQEEICRYRGTVPTAMPAAAGAALLSAHLVAGERGVMRCGARRWRQRQ